MMTDHSILFQPTMVEALQAGRKTQTRRMPNSKNTSIDGRGWQHGEFDLLDWSAAWLDNDPSPTGNAGPYLKVPSLDGDTVHRIYPRVQAGDRFWVKERHWAYGHWETSKTEVTKTQLAKRKFIRVWDETVLFKSPLGGFFTSDAEDMCRGWYKRNSLFMHKADSRMTLPVTGVRFQRMQDISRGDAMEEGCPFKNMADGHSPVDWFSDLINSINGPDTWYSNPWVLAYTFEVGHRNILEIENLEDNPND